MAAAGAEAVAQQAAARLVAAAAAPPREESAAQRIVALEAEFGAGLASLDFGAKRSHIFLHTALTYSFGAIISSDL